MNDLPMMGVMPGYAEFSSFGITTTTTGGSFVDVVFDPKNPLTDTTISPYGSSNLQDADGWIDVRGFSDITIYARATTQNANVKVLSRVHTRDPDTADLAGSTLVTAGAGNVQIYAGKSTNISHVKIQEEATTVIGGTVDVMVLLKGFSIGT